MTDHLAKDSFPDSGDTSSETESFEKSLEETQNTEYFLRLYISGHTQKSTNAILQLREVCEEYLKGRYQLEVIDIHQQPELARDQQIIATPTLIKTLPLPLRRMIGDLSQREKMLVGLDLRQADR
jgi:circadian clock protein KaiB